MTSGFSDLEMLADVDVGGLRGSERISVSFMARVPVAGEFRPAGTFNIHTQDVDARLRKLLGHQGRAYEKADKYGWDLTEKLGMPLSSRHALTGSHVPPRRGLGPRVIPWGSADLKHLDLSAAEPRIRRMQALAAETLVFRDDRVYRRTDLPVWFAEPSAGAVYLMDRSHRPSAAPTFDLFDPDRLDDAMRMAAGGRDRNVRVYGSIDDLDMSFDEHRGTRFARGFSAWVAQSAASTVLEMDGDLVRHWHLVGAIQAELEALDVGTAATAAMDTVRFVERLVHGEAGEVMQSHFGRRWERILARVGIEGLPFVPRERPSAEVRP